MLITKKSTSSLAYVALFALIFFSFYFALGSYPLLDNNEGLYASIAKNMLLQKNFVIPHLNGVPYIEKPPLLYWLLAGSFHLFGYHAWAARLVTTSSAALLVGIILYFTRRWGKAKAGFLGAIIFSSSIGIAIIARMVYFDMLFTLLISLNLFCWFQWHRKQSRSILRLGYFFLGLAVLTKGMVAGILVYGSFTAFLILEKDYCKLIKLFDPLGILLFLIVTLPWHIAATLQHRGFAWHYFIEEHILRFLNQREPHDYYNGPIYYYLPRILIYLFPWSLSLPWIFKKNETRNPGENQLLRFCWCWLLVPLLFFSISSAKANYYMIVSMPALALILGIKLDSVVTQKVFKIWGSTALIIIALALLSLYQLVPSLINGISIPLTVTAMAILGLALVIILFATSRTAAAIIFSLSIVPTITLVIAYLEVNQTTLSTASAGSYLNKKITPQQALYLYQDFENISALAFYAPRYFKIIDSKSSDLYYGAHLEEYGEYFIDKTQLAAIPKNSIIVVPTKKLRQFYGNKNLPRLKPRQCFDRLVMLATD